jgi:hypothetical protein
MTRVKRKTLQQAIVSKDIQKTVCSDLDTVLHTFDPGYRRAHSSGSAMPAARAYMFVLHYRPTLPGLFRTLCLFSMSVHIRAG